MISERQVGKQSYFYSFIPVLVCLIVVFSPFLANYFWGWHYKRTWWSLGVDAYKPYFADLRGVLAPIECFEQGLDPYLNNPCDFKSRPFNYPRIWLSLSSLGLNQSHSEMIGISLGLLWLVFVFILNSKQKLDYALIMTLCLISPPVLLALERGNIDLIIFMILALIPIMASYNSFLATLLILLSAVLKLFPAVLFVILPIEWGKKGIICFCSGVLLFAGYIFITFSDLTLIFNATPAKLNNAFGAPILFEHFNFANPKKLALGAAFIGVGISFFLGLLTYDKKNTFNLDSGLSFLIGTLIFVSTFSLSHNFNYRLIFTLFTVAFLIGNRGIRSCQIALIILLLVLWGERWKLLSDFFIDEIFNWSLMLILSYITGQILKIKVSICRN